MHLDAILGAHTATKGCTNILVLLRINWLFYSISICSVIFKLCDKIDFLIRLCSARRCKIKWGDFRRADVLWSPNNVYHIKIYHQYFLFVLPVPTIRYNYFKYELPWCPHILHNVHILQYECTKSPLCKKIRVNK